MIARFTTRLRTYRAYSKTILALRGMDDRMLADIGVTRGDIGRAVRAGRV